MYMYCDLHGRSKGMQKHYITNLRELIENATYNNYCACICVLWHLSALAEWSRVLIIHSTSTIAMKYNAYYFVDVISYI